ncbi:hypothetical protein P9112_005828 [Eukaryota sp. TZLM1-RC]
MSETSLLINYDKKNLSKVQRKLPKSRYKIKNVKLATFLSYIGIVWICAGYVNNSYLRSTRYHVSNFFLSSYTEVVVMLLFGLWRIYSANIKSDRARMYVVVLGTVFLYMMLPLITNRLGLSVPYPFLEKETGFNGVHAPGAVTFWIWGLLMIFFGRRLDCGLICTCVSTRETVGFVFRKNTKKGHFWNKFIYLKYVVMVYMFLMIITMYTPLFSINFSNSITKYWHVVPDAYFISLFLMPIFGNRSFCRWLCPFGAMYSMIGKVSMYKLTVDPTKCVGCRKCDVDCDMGILLSEQISEAKDKGKTVLKLRNTECMGCLRCVDGCPKGAIAY